MKKQIEIPLALLIEVSEMLLKHDLEHEIIAADEVRNTITLELSYSKEKRPAIHELEDFIEDRILPIDEENSRANRINQLKKSLNLSESKS